MPILSISGRPLEFQAFWCDVRDPTAGEPGLVALAFAQPFPVGAGLAVIGHHAGRPYGLRLCEPSKAELGGRRLIGVPVPSQWETFSLSLTPYGDRDVGPEVNLAFARKAPAGAAPLTTGHVLHVMAARPWIEARLHFGNAFLPSRLRLYQHAAADTILPSLRVSDASAVHYRIEVRAPPPSRVTDAGTGRPRPDENALTIAIHARNDEARRAIGDTSLWHASQVQLAAHLPREGAAPLGVFPPRQTVGFAPLDGVSRPGLIEFSVRGAAPGDVLCLAPGIEEAAINLGPEIAPVRVAPDRGLLIFELDRDGKAVGLNAALERPRNGKMLDRGVYDDEFKTYLRAQVAHIRANFTGGKGAMGGLAKFIADNSDRPYQVGLAQMEKDADSPAYFALCVVLLHDLLRRAGPAAGEMMAIAAPGQARIAERLCSAAMWRAVSNEKNRNALTELIGGPHDPWSAEDGLGVAFATAFASASRSDRQAADDWYEQTGADPAARAALLAIERRSAEDAWVLIRSGFKPSLGDLGKQDLDSIVAFSRENLLRPPHDLALTDALRFASDALEQDPDLVAVAAELRERITLAQSGVPAAPKVWLAVEDVRRFLAAVQEPDIAATLDEIRALLRETDASSAIPRFERGRVPLDRLAGAIDLIDQLHAIGELPLPWAVLRREATRTPWPAASLAALLATLRQSPPKEPPLNAGPPEREREIRQQEIGALIEAARTADPQKTADVAAVRYLFEGADAASGFVQQMSERARRLVADNERVLDAQPGLAADKTVAARYVALARLTDIARRTIEDRQKKVAESFEDVKAALTEAERRARDATQLGRLREIEDGVNALGDEYVEKVERCLGEARRAGRDIFQNGLLMQVQDALATAIELRQELRRLRARVSRIAPAV